MGILIVKGNAMISPTLREMLDFARTNENEVTWLALSARLQKYFNYNLGLAGVVRVMINIYIEVLREPRFDSSYGRPLEDSLKLLMLMPLEGLDSGRTHTLDAFYNSMLRNIVMELNLCKIDWLSEENVK